MQIDIKKLDEKATLPVVLANGSSFDLTCIGIATGVGRDGRLILEYKTGLEITIPSGHMGMIFLADGGFVNSLVLTNAVATFLSDSIGEITIKFKTNTDSVPAIYEPGEVFAKMVIVKSPTIKINELPMDAKEIAEVATETEEVINE